MFEINKNKISRLAAVIHFYSKISLIVYSYSKFKVRASILLSFGSQRILFTLFLPIIEYDKARVRDTEN